MGTLQRDRAIAAGLAAAAFAVALAQRPGLASSDTKVDLHVDPAGFLGDVASAWSSTGDLGHVQGGQYGGYLFPMGPFFALGHALGAAPWLVQRLWLGLVLALAVLGTVHLLDLLAGRPRGLPHVVAGALTLLNPYVVVFAARTSVTLLGYAALPWLLVCLLRGLREEGTGLARWRWPAAFALVLTASGGGVNAAVVAWVLLGPLLLAGYEAWTGAASARAIGGFAWRAALASAAACAWWVLPLVVQSRYGVDFLRFTEQPGTIWSTTSLPESLRLMGYWISYLGVGYGGVLRPYFGDGGVLLFALPVVIAGLLVPAVALTGFAWTRRHPYGPFLLVLVLAGLVAMTVGFPEGTPLRRAANFTYNHVAAVQFLRTTYKAGPLVAVGIAGLAGLAVARHRALAIAFVALAAVASWPLVRGRALDDQLLWQRVPTAWEQAAAHVDRMPDGRAVVLPGQLYAYYRWGGTIDPILPAIAKRPVAVRNAVGYADLHAVDLLWTVDALVSQRRALPGQLPPLLDLLGARTVISGADDDRTRSGAAPAAEAAGVLDQLGRPSARWGAAKREPPAAGTLDAPRRLPQVRAWDRPRAPGLVRVEPRSGGTVIDGSAEGVADLAAFGPLPSGLRYAGDLTPDELRQAAEVVITDSNRRRVLVVSRLAQNTGATLSADEQPSVDAAVLDPFAAGPDAQTVAVYDGIRSVTAPSSPGFPQFPERRPFAALDGDPGTHWQADRNLTQDRHTLDVTFDRPRDVDHVDLLRYDDERATVTAVEVAGRRFGVHAGWNRLRLGLRGVRSLRVRIAAIRKPADETAGAGGIRELRIPGVRAREALRVPVVAERGLAGKDLSRTGLTYIFQRTTGDDPFRRDRVSGPAGAALVRDRGDAERGLERIFAPPLARDWTFDGWAGPAPGGADDALDRLAGFRGPERFTSSGRFESRPGWRASSAFDGTARPWIGAWLPGRATWLGWTTPRATALETFRLRPVAGVRRPTLVRLHWDGRVSAPLRVAADGTVRLPTGVRGRVFRLDILRAAFPAGTTGVVKQRRAVGIAELEGAPRVRIPRSGPVHGKCGDLRGLVFARALLLRISGTVADLDAGRPLRMTGCDRLLLPPGEQRLSLPPGAMAPYLLRLRSAAPSAPAASPGRVVSSGDGRKGIRLDLHAPARLVLAEGYDRGRRASCDGHDLGTPQVGDAFGTAWDVPASCRDVEIAFAPDRLVRAGYIVSLVTAIALLALIVVGWRRAKTREGAVELREEEPVPWPVRQAVMVAIVAGLALGFVFAARATPLFALGVYVVLRRGIGARRLSLAAGALLGIAVPVLTLLIHPPNRGGYNPEYSIKRIAVHWVAVAGVTLLFLALARALSARGRRYRA